MAELTKTEVGCGADFKSVASAEVLVVLVTLLVLVLVPLLAVMGMVQLQAAGVEVVLVVEALVFGRSTVVAAVVLIGSGCGTRG